MTAIRIVTDSSCDLPAALADSQHISIVPLTIRFGNEEFVDRRDLSPSQFWARCAASPVLPETSAPSAGAFEETFRALAAEGADGIVCINISAELSATIQAAQIAARSVADTIPVRVIDSRSASTGQGMLAVVAARMAEAGKGLEDVAGAICDLVPRTRVYAALDTMENLKKGGRVGGATAMIGTMLSIKPVIAVVDGKVEEEAKPRTRSKSLRYLADKVRAEPRVENMAIMHGDAPDIDELLDLLATSYPRDEILVGDIGAVIGAHTGPRTIGVTFTLPA